VVRFTMIQLKESISGQRWVWHTVCGWHQM
jgi:hypothetical protein